MISISVESTEIIVIDGNSSDQDKDIVFEYRRQAGEKALEIMKNVLDKHPDVAAERSIKPRGILMKNL